MSDHKQFKTGVGRIRNNSPVVCMVLYCGIALICLSTAFYFYIWPQFSYALNRYEKKFILVVDKNIIEREYFILPKRNMLVTKRNGVFLVVNGCDFGFLQKNKMYWIDVVGNVVVGVRAPQMVYKFKI